MSDPSHTGDRYAIVGNPVAHSKSPEIHAAFARQTAQNMVYERIFCELDAFAETVRRFQAEGGKGLNITLPFKHQAFDFATRKSVRAELAGAVNTLAFSASGNPGAGDTAGDNTDGAGLTRDISVNLGYPLRGKRVLLLGAGGASFGVAGPLLGEAPRVLVIANRTLSKAQALVQRFAKLTAGREMSASSYAALGAFAGMKFDVVINATSAGLSGDMPALPDNLFAPGALAYDMVYGKTTPFLRFAQGCASGVQIADGLGMLVEQAAESFLIWRGVRPATAPVIAALRNKHSGPRTED